MAALVTAIGVADAWAGCGSEACGGEKKADESRCGDKAPQGVCGAKAADGECPLGLSDEDRAKVQAIVGEAHKEMAAWRKENAEAFKGLRTRWAAAKEADDEAAMKELVAEKEALMAEAKALHAKYEAQLAEILTEEQLAKLQKMMKGRCGGRRGHHRGGGKGRCGGEGKCGDGDKGACGDKGECGDGDKDSCGDKPDGASCGDRGPKNRLAPFRKMGECLGLSDEQKAQAKEILKDAMLQCRKAETEEAKDAIFKAAEEKIAAEVLTPEQLEKAKALRAACEDKGGCGGKGHRGGKGACGDKADGACPSTDEVPDDTLVVEPMDE